MTSTYLRQFQDAMARSRDRDWPELDARLNLDPGRTLDLEAIRRAVAEDFSVDFVDNTWELAGRCYLVARELSYVLFNLRLPHAVTIGNVLLDGKEYFTTTLDSLTEELRKGYIPNEPANAHCWITLVDGSILDSSLMPSIAHREGAKAPPSFYEAVTLQRHDAVDRLKYRPYLTGLHYHFNVVTHHLFDRHFETYAQWVDDLQKCTRREWWGDQ